MCESFPAYCARKRAILGERFDPSDLDPRFVPYFESGERIKVETCGLIRYGTVSVTTGWRPTFLLMRSSRAMGSPWTLGPRDKILAIQRGRTYFPA